METLPDQLPITTIPITNRYHVLHNLQNDMELPSVIPNQRTTYLHTKKREGNRKPAYKLKQQKKVMVIGDSHSRGLASELQSYLGHKYSISGTIIPGASLNNITQLAKKELTNLTRSDTVIVWGGSNDVYKNEALTGLKCLYTFVSQRTTTNILTLTVPHRHDLTLQSCVNGEIQTYNRKLHKIMKNIDGVKVIDNDLTREDYTRHGFHINARGKAKVASKITQILTQLSKQNEITSLPMPWKKTIVDPNKLGSSKEAPKNATIHQNDKQGGEKEVKEDKYLPQPQLVNQGDTKLIPIQRNEATPGPAHQISINNDSNKEVTHQELKEQVEEGEKRDMLLLLNQTQQKMSCRKKMVPLTRMDDFLWG